MARDQVLSKQAIQAMVENGDTIVIFQDYVLRLNSWLKGHPGGDLAILHMVGRDATSEITMYHSAATLKTMKAFRIGRKPMGPWLNMTPPIRRATHPHSIPDLSTEAVRFDEEKRISGVFAPADDADAHRHAAVGSDAPADSDAAGTGQDLPALTLTPSAGSADSLDAVDEKEQCLQTSCQLEPILSSCSRRTSSTNGSTTPQRPDTADHGKYDEKTELLPRTIKRLSPDEYTSWAIEQGKHLDIRNYPSLEQPVQQAITEKYMKMHDQIIEEGLYQCRYLEYGKEMVRYTTLFALSMTALYHAWYMTSAVFLGLFWHQIMFTAHDAGHRAITHIFVVDTLIGMFIADFCCGLSIGWWKSSHNVHHLITNQPEHDPDIQNVPLFATCPSFFKSLRSTYYDFTFVWDKAAEILVPYQQYTYYPVMGIARFNLYLLSWIHVILRPSTLGGSKAWWIRPTEIVFMACYWFIFGYCLLWRTLPDWTTRVLFVLVSHIITMPLHVQITLSHWGMSTSDLGEDESFAQRQLRTTMDVDCPPWLDFIHGGLQFQAVHHLFPRVPRHNLRRVQTLVKQFCEETGIQYSILGFVDGNRKVLSRLEEVSDQVKILVSCQKYMAETGESGLH